MRLSSGMPLLTVLLPLHQARGWVDVISENIKRCPKDCCIMISDRTLADDAICILKTLHAKDRRITFLGKKGTPGWRGHVNWLLPKVKTRFFSILAQDDTIADGYFEMLLEAHQRDPGLAISFGSIIAHDLPGKTEPVQFAGLPIKTGVNKPWEEAIELSARWNLGIPYRGVIKRNYARAIAPTPSDRFADFVWVFGIGLKGYLHEVKGAIYHKRYHDESAHANWRPLTSDEKIRFLEIELKRGMFLRPFELKKRVSQLLSRLKAQ